MITFFRRYILLISTNSRIYSIKIVIRHINHTLCTIKIYTVYTTYGQDDT